MQSLSLYRGSRAFPCDHTTSDPQHLPSASVGLSVKKSPYGNRVCFYKHHDHCLGYVSFNRLSVCLRMPSETQLLSDSVWKGRSFVKLHADSLDLVILDLADLEDESRTNQRKKREFIYVEMHSFRRSVECSRSEIANICRPVIASNALVATSMAYCNLKELDKLLFKKGRAFLEQTLEVLKEEFPEKYRLVLHTQEYKSPSLSLKSINSVSIFSQVDAIWSQLVWLKSVDINDCLLCGVPESIGQLTQLQRLDLSDNLIANLPSTMGSLQNLRELILVNNVFYRFKLSCLLRMRELKKIDLRGNPLEEVTTDVLQIEEFLFDPLSHSENSLPSDPSG